MLSRISKHLNCMKFVDLSLNKNVIGGINCLSLGQQLRDNIIRERGTEQIILDRSFDYQTFPAKYLQENANLKRKNPLEIFHLQNFQSHPEDSPEFLLNSCQVLCSTSLVSAKHAFELFYQLQRQRKIWWMQFVYNPGQIVFSNPTRTELSQSISISMKSAHFNMELERIELSSYGDSPKMNALQSWFVVDRSVVAFLIDSLPEVETDDFTMHLHRKLSPYKIGILLEATAGESAGDLRDLGKLVGFELEKSHLNVFDEYEIGNSLEDNLAYSDKIGTPYNLILSNASLESGLLELRNRNTTLSEVIHISDVPEHLDKIIGR